MRVCEQEDGCRVCQERFGGMECDNMRLWSCPGIVPGSVCGEQDCGRSCRLPVPNWIPPAVRIGGMLRSMHVWKQGLWGRVHPF